MRGRGSRASGLAVVAALTVAGCGIDRPDELASAQTFAELEPAAAPVEKTGETLVRFDLMTGDPGELVGTYARRDDVAAPNGYTSVWAGPHPTTGEQVFWAGSASVGGVVLVTAGPPDLKLNISTDTFTVYSGALGSAGRYRLVRSVFR